MGRYNQVEPKQLGSKTSQSPSKPTAIKPDPLGTDGAPEPIPQALTAFTFDLFSKMEKLSTEDQEICREQLTYLVAQAKREKKLNANNWARQKLPVLTPWASLDLEVNLRKPFPAKVKKRPAGGNTDYDSEMRKKMRGQRFEKELATPTSVNNVDEDFNYKRRLVGTCQDLEKRYLRLTSAPDPSRVRPLNVLKKALEFVINKYNSNDEVKYNYVCDQLKSIRQDLTVQLIRDEFAVQVYETHAKIAIENDDLGEYNQCQSRLNTLYQGGENERKNKLEFLSYKIVYFILTENYSEICKLKLTELYDEPGKYQQKANNVFISFALQLFDHCYQQSYVEFFNVVARIKKWNKRIVYQGSFSILIKFIRKVEEKLRIKSFHIMSRAYRQLSVKYLAEKLKFKYLAAFHSFLTKVKLMEYVKGDVFEFHVAKPAINSLYTSISKVDIKGQK